MPQNDPSSESDSNSTTTSPVDWEKLEGRLERFQRLKTLGLLVEGVSSDFTDLLQSVKGNLHAVRDDLPDGHVAHDRVDHTLSGLEEAEALLEKLTHFSQTSSEPVREPVDFVSLVREALALAGTSFPEEFTLRTRFGTVGSLQGDPAQLQQMVMELVTNAGRAMESQRREAPTVLEVVVQQVNAKKDLADQYLDLPPGPYVHLSVGDTGPGMSEHVQERLFEPFFTTWYDRGIGLGLPAARSIIEAHDGHITGQSEPGKGTTVDVYLPLVPEADSPSDAQPEEPVSGEEGHVLVVDDDKTVRNLEGIRLSRLGYNVTTKVNAEQALDAVEEDPDAFDIVLIDYHMPEMNGLELTHALRETGYEMPVVLMTGFTAQVSEAKARVVGVDRLLKKPVERNELGDVLADVG